MSRFRVGQGGPWLVCQTLGPDREVINSCRTYGEAEERAGFTSVTIAGSRGHSV